MTTNARTGGADLLTVLELLAEEAPPSRFEELLQGARRAGEAPDDIARLERAVSLARGVHALQGRRRQREDGLADLVDTARDLTFPYELDSLLRVITRRVKRLLNFDMTCVALTDADGTLYARTSEGSTTALANEFRIGPGRGLGHRALTTGAPVWTADYPGGEGIEACEETDVVRAEGLHALMAVPLLNGNSPVGVLYGATRAIRHFSPDEIGLVCSLAMLAAVAIERAERLEQARGEVDELELDGLRTRTSLVRLQQLNEAHSRTMSLLLAGADLTTVAKAAGDALDGTLQLRDPAGRLLAGGGEIPDLDEEAVARTALEAHTRRTAVAASGNIWVAPVIAGAEDLGFLILRPATALVGEDERLLHLTAQAFAIQLLLQHSTALAEGPVRDELFDDLLATSSRSAHRLRHLAKRAHRIGLDLDAPHVLVVGRPEGGEHGRALVWASSYAHRMSGLKTAHDGCILLLLPGDDASAAARAVADELSPLLGHPVSVGAAGPGRGPAETRRMHQEAVRCLDVLTALNGAGSVASVRDLGFLGLLLSDDHDVDSFIESAIGPVLGHDQERQTDLIATLEAFFAAGSSPTNAAEALHVHPNTVSRRLERISELLGPEWAQPDRTLEVQLALRVLRARDVLQQQPNTAAGQADAGPAARSIG
ncbi:helix-turn-helix domain-containing protein [Streptomyces cyaneofuscatus]|uniref:helix-turn-helix domain-containing protein n=1 Tax=Streptomyces cyaneofuscatus TaxID=66883 RepID=UPI0036596B73